MRKAQPRKLVLYRETLRQLQRMDLRRAAGNVETPACPTVRCVTDGGSFCNPKCPDYTEIGTCTC